MQVVHKLLQKLKTQHFVEDDLILLAALIACCTDFARIVARSVQNAQPDVVDLSAELQIIIQFNSKSKVFAQQIEANPSEWSPSLIDDLAKLFSEYHSHWTHFMPKTHVEGTLIRN